MNFILKVLTSLLLLILLGFFSALFLLLDNYPVSLNESQVSPQEFQQTLSFIEKSDPRNLQPGTITSLTIREEDLQILLNYILDSTRRGAGEVNINEGLITTLYSMKMPPILFERYFNLQIAMSNNEESVVIEKLKLGKLELPNLLTNALMKYLHEELSKKVPEYAEILNAITGYKVGENDIMITYQWRPELVELLSSRGSGFLIQDDEKERLIIYTLKLAEITNDTDLPPTISLADLFSPMFEFAQFRGGDPVEENAAAITAMALYMMDISIAQVFGGNAGAIPVMEPHKITLTGRQDFAKHFLTSAAITISANTSIADSFGMVKEIEDASAGGSGFSFTDVGADRAGVRFAELAISNSRNAVLLQNKLSGNLSEDVFIPDLKGLPEFMPEDEFLSRYGGLNQPEFQSVMTDIEERISLLPLFNSL